MIAVTIALRPRESRNQYIRTEGSDDANHISERDIMAAPFFERFPRILRKSEVSYPRKPVLDAIVLIGCEKFLCAENSQDIGEVAANLVLPSFSAIQGH